MKQLGAMTAFQMRRRATDGFAIGYNIVFPMVLITILGTLGRGRQQGFISSYQYYTLVLLPFCTSMAVITAAYAGKEDAFAHTAMRIIMSPLSNIEIVLAKMISCTVVYSICNGFMIVVTKLIWRVSYQGKMVPVLFLLTATAFCVCSLGVLIGLGMKNFLTVKNVLNIPISLCAIAAGSFFPVGTLNRRLQFLLDLSPLTWINRSIFLCIYDGKSDLLWGVSAALLIAGGVFIWLAMKYFKREEYLNGQLPGSEK